MKNKKKGESRVRAPATGGCHQRHLQVWTVDQRVLYQTYFLFVMILQFLFPVVIMTICYSQVCKELWFKAVPGEQTTQVKYRLLRRRRTVLVLVLVLYVFCWSPYYVFSLLRDFHGSLVTTQRHALTVFYTVDCLAMSNGVCNTLCFVWVRARSRTRTKTGTGTRNQLRLRSIKIKPSPTSTATATATDTETSRGLG